MLYLTAIIPVTMDSMHHWTYIVTHNLVQFVCMLKIKEDQSGTLKGEAENLNVTDDRESV